MKKYFPILLFFIAVLADQILPQGSGSFLAGSPGLGIKPLALLTRQIATLLRAGIPLEETLSAIANQTRNQKVRRIVRNAFTPKRVESYTEKFREHAKRIVDERLSIRPLPRHWFPQLMILLVPKKN